MDFYSAIQSAPGCGHIAPQSLAHFAPQRETHKTLERITENEPTETNTLALNQNNNRSNGNNHDFHVQAGRERISEMYDVLLQQHTTLKQKHEQLKTDFASLAETVQVLGAQSSCNQAQGSTVSTLDATGHGRHAQAKSSVHVQSREAQNAKMDLISRCNKLQEQLQQVHESNSDLVKRHLSLQEQFQQVHASKSDLMQQN